VVRETGCGLVASFSVHGHAGVNRLRFAGRIRGRRLPPGTYRIRGRSRGSTVLLEKLVVGSGRSRGCDRTPFSGATGFFGATGFITGSAFTGGSAVAESGHTRSASSNDASIGQSSPPKRSGVLGTTASKILPGSDETQLALIIVLAAAISLLALGALPQAAVPHAALGAFLTRRRTLISAAGLTALTAVAVSYFVT
jgi:hypothetical protein